MSVNAINAADAQQQPKKSNAGSAVAAGVGLGAVGAGAGYFIGNKRPSLEEVFSQKPDTFTSEAVKSADAAAAKTLEDAVKEYEAAGDAKAVTEARKNRAAAIDGQKPDNLDELNSKVTEAQDKLRDKKVKVGDKDVTYAEANTEYKTALKDHKAAEKAVADAGESATQAQKDAVTAAKTKLDAATETRKTVVEGAKEEVNGVITARRNLNNAKMSKFAEQAKVADSAEEAIEKALTTAKNNLTEARNTKKTEILGRDNIKEAFEKIKSAVPKEGGKKMAMYAGIGAAVVGLLAGAMLGGKKEA